jgi:hypothetical protein
LKVASFTVRASMPQSVRWKQAAEGEGFASVGSWAGSALDAYLEGRRRAGRPIPLAWHRGAVRVALEGREVTLKGWVSPPFGIFCGTVNGPGVRGSRLQTLVHLPAGRIVATLRAHRQCRALAAELAPIFARDEHGGTATVERHASEQA